jgi:hypothetical protein
MEREICLNKDGKTQIEFLVLRSPIEQEYTRYRYYFVSPPQPEKQKWLILSGLWIISLLIHWQTFARPVNKQQQIDLEKEHKTPKKPSGIPLFSKYNFCFLFTFIASWKLDIVCHSTTVTFPKRFTLNTINKVHCYIVNLARCYLMVKVSSQGNPKGNFLLFFNWFELQIITKQNYQKVLHRQSEFLRVFFFSKKFLWLDYLIYSTW